MFNPLVESFDKLTDAEIDEAVRSLSRKYFQTRNPQLQEQISVLLEMYQEELRTRTAKKALEAQENSNSDLDNLIKVS